MKWLLQLQKPPLLKRKGESILKGHWSSNFAVMLSGDKEGTHKAQN